jgi:CRISPR-associated endonuclease/helicase Cas3
LHDVGKVSGAFQAYIRATSANGSCDHSTAGARVAVMRFGGISRALAYAIAGHHAGLADAGRLEERLDASRTAIPHFDGWEAHVGPLPDVAALRPGQPIVRSKHPCFEAAFLTRMLFSCLVDADFIATERFYAEAEGGVVERGSKLGPAELLRRLRHFTAGRAVDDTPLNALRSAIHDHAVAKAALPPGPFTLTVPTGGGKTLTSLRFALEHAAAKGLRRVIYVVPFTSIIEQTAAVFRDALGPEGVLEHHASFDWEDGGRAWQEEGGNPDRERMRRAAENWDAPVVVTTSVQFFESLYASRTSRCRKLHNLARAVIVLDEAQSLPLRLLSPCLAALDELGRNYGCSTVLCTATQPAVRRTEDALPAGLDLSPGRELAPDPPALFAQLRRQRVEWLSEPIEDAIIVRRFAAQRQMLCIVNGRRNAFDLFGRIRGMEGAVHLSTYMCPSHRSLKLAEIKLRLKQGLPVRLVSTSLVEAGVDFSFPEVWRAEAGLDSVAQAAGRCNREGELLPTLGRVVVFRPAGLKPSAELALPAQCATAVASQFEDPLVPEAVRSYFRTLYANRGDEFFDSAKLEGMRFPILPRIGAAGREGRFDFDSIARAFRMIENDEPAVIVPWREGPGDGEAHKLLANVTAAGSSRESLRALQRYAVPVPRELYRTWLAAGVLFPVHPALGEALLRLEDDTLYDAATGLRVFDPTHRDSASNVF